MPDDNKFVNLADLKDAFDSIDNRKKDIQSAVSDPSASGAAIAFIDSISQNAQGVIAATKKTVSNATQSTAGLMSAADKTKLDTDVYTKDEVDSAISKIVLEKYGISMNDIGSGNYMMVFGS